MHNFFILKKKNNQQTPNLEISLYYSILSSILFCSTWVTLLWSIPVIRQTSYRDCTLGPLSLPLSLTKHMVAVGWCFSVCAKLHLLCWMFSHLFADSGKWDLRFHSWCWRRSHSNCRLLPGSYMFRNLALPLCLFYCHHFSWFLLWIKHLPSSWIQESHAPCLQLKLPDQTECKRKAC